ncbi:unnamed protein product [Dibothriocephalus latus]|uniref:UBFD1 PH-like C-terminal domain-containing protein n=1 Tax=Dibothriocephalus latus TaxID=60516 RepID=A0A3P7P740_DIBLA|nr:unnamed protein product [Dibothriocephalus latus]
MLVDMVEFQKSPQRKYLVYASTPCSESDLVGPHPRVTYKLGPSEEGKITISALGYMVDFIEIDGQTHTPVSPSQYFIACQVRKAEQTAQPAEAASGPVTDDSDSDLFSEGEHRRVLERFGMPDDVMVGIMNSQDLLAPGEALSGMYDKRGQSLRLRFKPETSELWLATNSVTHKVPLATIHDVRSQPIKEHPEYHIMSFQLGPTKKSRFFVYWLPAQYVECIKTMVMQHRLLHGDRRTSF